MKIQWRELVILIMTVMLVKITVADPIISKKNKDSQKRQVPYRDLASEPVN